MPLALPDLDDRRWADLVAEGRSLIPLYAPGWTDHNVHDPGITLIELLAWVAEMDLYQVNRIPRSRVRKLLALAAVTPNPPRPARTVLALTPKQDGAALPAGTTLEAQDLAGGWMPWRTLEPVTPTSLRLEAVQVGGSGGFTDLTARWLRGEAIALCGEDPAAGSALYLGFDWQTPPSQPVSLWFRFAGPGTDDDERACIAEEAALAHAACHPSPIPCRCGCWSPSSPGEGGWVGSGEEGRGDEGLGRGARTVWEMLAGPGLWRPLDPEAGEVVDDTRSLTLDGRVLVTLSGAVKARVGAVKEELHYLRCRLVAGAWDDAPRLANLAVNGVRAEQAEEDAFQGEGNGAPFQQLALPKAPVADGVLTFESFEGGKWRPWEVRPDFDGSRRDSAHLLLDPTQGVITAGDGENGRTIPEGVEVRAAYRATRAIAGNLPAGRAWRFTEAALNSGITIANPLPATGGAAEESLEEATARAVDLVNRPFRAVTLGDCERLALETPGVRLARASARADFDPTAPCFVSPGVITVIVLPRLPRHRPVPSAGLLRTVGAYLGRRRVIGTRIQVVGPTYLEVAVRARVSVHPGVERTALQKRLIDAINAFFDPLTGGPGGADGTGWPFGRSVYRSEVLQVLDETPGVDCVLSLELVPAGGSPVCGNLCLRSTDLVAAGAHTIEVE